MLAGEWFTIAKGPRAIDISFNENLFFNNQGWGYIRDWVNTRSQQMQNTQGTMDLLKEGMFSTINYLISRGLCMWRDREIIINGQISE